MNPVATCISTLFNSREQAHIFHLQSRSFAKHKTLNEYYDEIVGLVDDYVQTYQGRYGIITGYTPAATFFEEDAEVLNYFMALAKYIDTNRGLLPADTDLNNIMDEISGLIRNTIYKLTFLS
jgi:hypothetical protein